MERGRPERPNQSGPGAAVFGFCQGFGGASMLRIRACFLYFLENLVCGETIPARGPVEKEKKVLLSRNRKDDIVYGCGQTGEVQDALL